MNIFILDESPILSAKWQHDRHVVKMILESAQLLSTAVHESLETDETIVRFGLSLAPEQFAWLYKSTHRNHPCAVWARSSWANFAWLTIHLDSLVAEYHRRFQKRHATDTLKNLFCNMVAKYCGVERFWTRDGNRQLMIDPAIMVFAASHSPFVYCGPELYKSWNGNEGAIDAYRTYYFREKIQGNRWSRVTPDMLPVWLRDHATYFERPQFQTVSRKLAPARPPVASANLESLLGRPAIPGKLNIVRSTRSK